MLEIRFEGPGDEPAIHHLHRQAFGQPAEAELVERLRENGNLFLSLVALLKNEASGEDEIVGHIAFVPITIERADEIEEESSLPFSPLGLAPLGVLPERQRKGVGTTLVQAGIEECERRGFPLIIVLGDPKYYGRFGFVTTAPFGIRSPFEVPQEVFMLRIRDANLIQGIRGVVRYTAEFDGLD